VVVVVLDRVLDREDVAVQRGVDGVEHRGQRRRLARAGRPGDENEAARPLAERSHGLRQADLVERHEPVGNQARHQGGVAALAEDRHPEARPQAVREAEVRAALLPELRHHALRRDGLHQLHRVGGLELVVLDVLEPAVPAHHRRPPDGDVNVRRILLDHEVEEHLHRDT
jgi:hypothetical protein